MWHPRLTPEEIGGGSRSITIGSDRVSLDLNLTAKAPDTNWMEALNEVGASLDQVIEKWKEGKKTGAMTQIMTTHSRIYEGSGLRNAISEKLGKSEAEAHDLRFNALIKQIQGEGPAVETSMRSEKEKLLSGLKRDIEKMK